MSEVILFKDVIDIWYKEKLGTKYRYDSGDKTVLQLQFIFANKGLQIVTSIPDKLRLRLINIVKKIKNNQKASRPKYNSFSDIETLFYSAAEFPDLCKIEDIQR